MPNPVETISENELLSLVSYIEDQYSHDLNFYRKFRHLSQLLLMYDAGLRVGELIRLRYSDIATIFNVVNIAVVLDRPMKSGNPRSVHMTERLNCSLRYLLNSDPLYVDGCYNQPVFHRPGCFESVSKRSIQSWFSNLCFTVLKRPVHCHVLRHSFATKMMRVAPLSVVQALLGHKHISSTGIYTHPNQDDLAQAIQKGQVPA